MRRSAGATCSDGSKPRRESEHRDPDRKVDEEDPVPVERVREDAAEQHTDAPAGGHHESEHPHRLRAFRGLGEEEHDQREGDRGDDRAADPLHRSRAFEHVLRARETTGERRQREERDSGEEHPPVPEQVTEPAAEQEKAAEREQVGVDHPRERGLREAEIGADRRQRDVHDRRVEHDHQVAEAQHDQRQPARPVGHSRAGCELTHGCPSPRCRRRSRSDRAPDENSSVRAVV